MNMLHTFRWRSACSVFVMILLFWVGNMPALAVDLPDRSVVQNQLTVLSKQKNLSAQDKRVQQDLSQTLDTLDKIEQIKSDSAQLRQQIEQAPAKMRQAVNNLNALSNQPDDETIRKTLTTLSLRQLESRVAQLQDDLQTAQTDLSTYNSQLVALQTQPERAQNAMYSASRQLQQIRNRLNSASVVTGDEVLPPELQGLLLAQQTLLNAQIDLQRKSLEGNTLLQDTLQKQRDYVSANSQRLEHQLQLLQEVVNSKRLLLTEKTAREAVTPNETSTLQSNPLIIQELDINHQLSQKLVRVTGQGNQLVQRNIQVKTGLIGRCNLNAISKNKSPSLKSLLLSRILYQQQQTLPSAEELGDMATQIADMRLEQFEINQQRDALFQSDAFVARLEEGHRGEITPAVHDALLDIIDMRRELLDQLNKQLGNQLMVAINLQINQQQLISVSGNLKAILTQQIFGSTATDR